MTSLPPLRIPAPHPADGARIDERKAQRVHTVAACVALIGACGFFLTAGFTAVQVLHGSLVPLAGDVGVLAVTAAIWFSGAFRAHAIQHRPLRASAASLLRSPSDWLPLPFSLDTFTVGNEPVEIVEPVDAAHRLAAPFTFTK
ncbi:hypothetical protein [Paraburkholderia dilworthii]|uniref:Uncharacterized protein n=1 Tax=Paraburkholderia dilworthii TaxID=948106 RepID=A0ABW9D7B2_9BURK